LGTNHQPPTCSFWNSRRRCLCGASPELARVVVFYRGSRLLVIVSWLMSRRSVRPLKSLFLNQ
jgi:hypothetical protein